MDKITFVRILFLISYGAGLQAMSTALLMWAGIMTPSVLNQLISACLFMALGAIFTIMTAYFLHKK